MSLEWFLAWWNLIFIAPFLLALLYLGIYTTSGLTFGEPDVDADVDGSLHLDADADVHAEVDADADLDADADFDADADGDLHGDLHGDVDADADADVDGDADAEAEAHGNGHAHSASVAAHAAHEAPVYLEVLSWLGLGRAPLSILLMVLFLTWGAVGFMTNSLLRVVLPESWLFLAASLPLAAISTGFVTHGISLLLGRWVPTMETYAHRRDELVGSTGQAIYGITGQFGLVSVRDAGGDLFQVACRVREHRPEIPKGTRVLLAEYDRSKQIFYVTPCDLGAEWLP